MKGNNQFYKLERDVMKMSQRKMNLKTKFRFIGIKNSFINTYKKVLTKC